MIVKNELQKLGGKLRQEAKFGFTWIENKRPKRTLELLPLDTSKLSKTKERSNEISRGKCLVTSSFALVCQKACNNRISILFCTGCSCITHDAGDDDDELTLSNFVIRVK